MEANEVEKLQTEAMNFRETLKRTVRDLMDHGDDAPAGLLLVLERRIYDVVNDFLVLADELVKEPVAGGAFVGKPTAPVLTPSPGPVKCRHEWHGDGDGKIACALCGAAKSARGRKARPQNGAPQQPPAVSAAAPPVGP